MARSVGNSTSSTGRRTASRAPRRTVTVLFIDIVGFSALVDRLDPEDVWALQKDYFSVVSRVVRAGGGVVEKYIGDAVVAVFGTGTGRADAAETAAQGAARAVRAGLRMQEALRYYPLAGRFPVRTRVGVATGVAIVDPDGARDGGQAMISGGVVVMASRLQAYAPHGTVVVCAATRHATDALVAYQELPPAVVPGRPYPLDLWRALSPLPSMPAAGVSGAPTEESPAGTSAVRTSVAVTVRAPAGLPVRSDAGSPGVRWAAVHAPTAPT